MEVINAVDPTRGIHGEGNPIQALTAHNTSEAGWMVRLASGTQNPVQDRLLTYTTLLQRVQVVIFTVRFSFHSKEGLSSQFFHAHMACEALDVIDLVHGSTTTAFSKHFFSTFVAHAEEVWIARTLHALHKQVCEMVYLGLLAATMVRGLMAGAHTARVVGRIEGRASAAVTRHLARRTWHNGLVNGARVVRAR